MITEPAADPVSGVATLQAALTFWESRPHVEMKVTAPGVAADPSARIWRVPAKEFGVPQTLDPSLMPDISLPLQVREGLRATLARLPLAATEPLWLRMVRPYGYLGVLPWERVLGDALARPVLRMPDYPERPRDNADVLDVAVCFDPAPHAPEAQAIDQVTGIVASILEGSARSRTIVNVFTTAAWFERVRAILAVQGGGRVLVHDPALSAPLGRTADGSPPQARSRLRASPWLDWICASLAGRSLDAVHFVSRAEVIDGCGALLLSGSPAPGSGLSTVSSLSLADIGVLLMRTGAWAAVFSPPQDGSTAAMVAFVADALARSAPCAVLYHDPSQEREPRGLAQAYQLLSEPGTAPILHGGFLYLPPSAVTGFAGSQGAAAPPAARQGDALTPHSASAGPLHGTEQPPSWIAATQRYLETVTLQQARRDAPDVLFSKAMAVPAEDLAVPNHAPGRPGRLQDAAESAAVQRTLADIQAAAGAYLKNGGLP